jgi:hypothetical protein
MTEKTITEYTAPDGTQFIRTSWLNDKGKPVVVEHRKPAESIEPVVDELANIRDDLAAIKTKLGI